MLTEIQCIKKANRYVPASLDNRADNSRNNDREDAVMRHEAI